MAVDGFVSGALFTSGARVFCSGDPILMSGQSTAGYVSGDAIYTTEIFLTPATTHIQCSGGDLAIHNTEGWLRLEGQSGVNIVTSTDAAVNQEHIFHSGDPILMSGAALTSSDVLGIISGAAGITPYGMVYTSGLLGQISKQRVANGSYVSIVGTSGLGTSSLYNGYSLNMTNNAVSGCVIVSKPGYYKVDIQAAFSIDTDTASDYRIAASHNGSVVPFCTTAFECTSGSVFYPVHLQAIYHYHAGDWCAGWIYGDGTAEGVNVRGYSLIMQYMGD